MSHSLFKDRLREKLRKQTEDFVAHGGHIDRVGPGVSGRGDTLRPPPATHFNAAPKASRTPVPEVVAAIELRRQQKVLRRKASGRSKPKRRLIYDDFGEPLRWEWVE